MMATNRAIRATYSAPSMQNWLMQGDFVAFPAEVGLADARGARLVHRVMATEMYREWSHALRNPADLLFPAGLIMEPRNLSAARPGGLGMADDPVFLSVAVVTDVVRQVVGELAPEELEVVDGVAEAWQTDEFSTGPSKRSPGAAVGFGVDEVLLSQLLFPIVSGAIGDVLGTIALEPARLKRKKALKAGAGAEPAGGSAADPVLAVPPLTKEQADDLHSACLRHARALRLPPAKAALMADAVVGSMTRR